MSAATGAGGKAEHLLALAYADLKRDGTTDRIGELTALLTEDLAASWRASIANILVHHHFQNANYPEALAFCEQWRECEPDNLTAVNSHVSILSRLKRWDDMIAVLSGELARHPGDFRLRGSLCHALGRLGRIDEARAHGTLCLALKDRAAAADKLDLRGVAVPPFRSGDRAKNVISFSLFGDGAKYLKGAVANVQAARHIYPDWSCRFYIDESVPRDIVRVLAAEGADLRTVEGLPGRKYRTFWRFLVAEDPAVERYLVRDCDSVVNTQERVAVDEWIESGRHFHAMRDFYTHTELLLAGMWGGVGGVFPRMGPAFCAYVEKTFQHRTLDQEFLRDRLWPTIRQSVLVHDSQFAFGERRDFPRLGRLPPGRSVGDSEF